MFYYVAGVGRIFGIEEDKTDEGCRVSYPAMGIDAVRDDQQVMGLVNFIPKFVKVQFNTVTVPKNLVMIRERVEQSLQETYLKWKRIEVRNQTGLVLPSGRAD